MRRTETRPFPANRNAVMRCAFLALAKLGAKLHSYDDQTGMLTATVAWRQIGGLDVFERIIEVRVQEYEGTSVLKLVAPPELSDAILRLISVYVVEGAQAIEEDAHLQWARLLKKEEARRQRSAKRQAWLDKLSRAVRQLPIIGSSQTKPEGSGEGVPAGTESAGMKIQPATAAPEQGPEVEAEAIIRLEPKTLDLAVPPSAGMLIADRRGRVFEIQVDDQTTADRRRHLVVCPDPDCSATNLVGSQFCFRCGKQLTLGAASDEIMRRVQSHTQSSLFFGALSLAPVTLLFVIAAAELVLAGGALTATAVISALTGAPSSVTSELAKGLVASTLPAMLFSALPSFLLGRSASSHAERALSDLTLNFLSNKAGRKRALLGRALGSVGMYAGIAVFLLVLLSSYIQNGR